MKRCIGLFDSGSGGLSVLREVVKLLPDARYIYSADNAYCPYGNKSRDYIVERSKAVTEHLLHQGVEVIVIACNTATAAAVKELRATYDIPFVGMEPAVKPAAALTRSGVAGVLATASTLGAEKYRTTKSYYEGDCRIVEHVGKGFVELVEAGILDGPEAEATVRASLEPLLAEGADVIVLGCTHYPFLLPLMQRIAGPGVTFIDPAPAVARQVVRVLGEKIPGRAAGNHSIDIQLEASGELGPLTRIYGLVAG